MSADLLTAAASGAEEWSDADFDLPEGDSLIAHLENSAGSGRGTSGSTSSYHPHLPQLNTKPNRPTALRMSTGPDEMEDEDDDLAAFLAEDDEDNIDTIKIPRGPVTATPTMTTSMVGTITRLNGVRTASSSSSVPTIKPDAEEDEDWDTDLDFTSAPRLGGIKKPLVTIASPIRDMSTWDEEDDDANISTIKASRLPPLAALTTTTRLTSDSLKPLPANTPLPPSPLPSPLLSPTLAVAGGDDDDESMESAFDIPTSLSRLSLRPLSQRTSKATLSTLSEWASDATTTTSTSTSATSDSFSDNGGKTTMSASASTDFTTDEEDEEREAKEVEGLVLPDSFLPKDLVRILDKKKKAPAAPPANFAASSRLPKPKSKHAEDEDDFENGLDIGNDSELSPSRLLRNGEPSGIQRPGSGAGKVGGVKSRLRPKIMTVPLSSAKPSSSTIHPAPSRATLSRAQTMLAVPTSSSTAIARDAMRNCRSPSPVPRRSEDSATSSSSKSGLTSKASTATLRRTKPISRGTATPPPVSFPRQSSSTQQQQQQHSSRSNQLSPPPLSHSYSMLTLPRIPGSPANASTSPSKNIKPQKSTSRLLMSPKALNPPPGTGQGTSPMRLGRKASLSSLVDAERARERLSLDRANRERDRESKTSTISSGSGSGSAGPSRVQSPASTSGSGSGGRAQNRLSSGNAASGQRLPSYMAPTSSTRAKAANPSSDRPSLSSLFLPVPRPTTPIDTPGAIRLTMPTSSTRAKARVPVSSVFAAPNLPPSRQSSTSPVPFARVVSPSRPRPTTATSSGPKLLKKPKTARAFGDGTELDSIDDLVVERDKERRFKVTPKGTSNGPRTSTGSKRPSTGTSSTNPTATVGRRAAVTMPAPLPTSSSTSTVTIKRPPSRASTVDTPRPPSSAASVSTTGTGTLLRRKSRMDLPSANTISGHHTTTSGVPGASLTNTIRASVPVLSPAPLASAYATLRRRKASTKTETIIQRKPTLIRNLGGVGSPKVVGDMRWNPVTLRWEGNDSELRGFETPIHSARPALITQLTGSSVGGVGSPTTSLLAGARIVGNMMFDPSKMCWVNRFADEEDDPFAGMDSDEDDKDATLGKRRGNALRPRSNTANIGAPSSGTPLETVAGSPARSAVSRTSHRTHHSTASESDTESMLLHPMSSARSSLTTEEEDDEEVMSGSGGSPERTRRAIYIRGASTSPIPGVDGVMLQACQAAEARHKQEMKGWFPRRRATSTASVSRSSSRKLVGVSLFERDTDEIDRSYLFEIRTLATKKY